MTEILSQCLVCRHFLPNVLDRNTCLAFPKGIPEPVFFNEVDHRQPVGGDNGIRFAPEGGKRSPVDGVPYLEVPL